MAGSVWYAVHHLWLDHLICVWSARAAFHERVGPASRIFIDVCGGHGCRGWSVDQREWSTRVSIPPANASPAARMDCLRGVGIRMDVEDQPLSWVDLMIRFVMVACMFCALTGCQLPGIIGAVGHNIEREKKIEVLAKYPGLDNKRVAVMVKADMGVLYEHPTAIPNIAMNLSQRIHENVPGVTVLDPRTVLNFQYQRPSWAAMSMSDIAQELDVDRVVVVDIYEYRLHPPGNRWMWEGVAGAHVGVSERDGIDASEMVDQWNVIAKFPPQEGSTRDQLNPTLVQNGLMATFVRNVAWVFYDHIEDKYPDIRK